MTDTVLDANVLASGFVRASPAAPPALILSAWLQRRFTLLYLWHIYTELVRTFEDRYFRRRMPAVEVALDLALLLRRAVLTQITVEIHGVATHPEDDLVLATAVSAQADYLVTGDAKLLSLGSYAGVGIVSPRKFLDAPTVPSQERSPAGGLPRPGATVAARIGRDAHAGRGGERSALC